MTYRSVVTIRAARVVAVAAVLCGASALRADQIVVDGRSFPGATIETLEDGHLQFRTIAGKPRTVWLSDVETIIVDQRGLFVDFNQAERYLANGDAARAVVSYRRALRRSDGFWSDLIVARLLAACGHSGQIELACQNFVATVRGKTTGPGLAARLLPRTIPSARSDAIAQGLEHLETAVAAADSLQSRTALDLLRYEILRTTGDDRATRMALRIATMPIPEALRCERSYDVVAAALRQAAEDGVDGEWLGGLDRAIRDCPFASLPDLLLLKGRILLQQADTRQDMIRAGWPFMRVAIHMPDDPRAAEGLLGAAEVVERIGRTDQAVELLEECLAHMAATDETKKAARASLARIRPGGSAAP
jgi:hypothetical protein